MTAVLDFATLPPEINSGRLYSGAGSGPMLAAASAWKGLAAELRSTALSYHSVLSALWGEEWHGPAAAAMAAAAMPYVAWMGSTAAQAEQAGAQAEGAAAAYDAAFAATIPPPVIAANRVQLMALIATNILGQNTPAIAATEAQYAEMWAQDAAAMYGYAASSATAAQLDPFTQPQQTTTPGGIAGQAAAVTQAAGTPAGAQQSTLAQFTTAVPAVLQNLASPASAPSSGVTSVLDPNSNFWNTLTSTGAFNPEQVVSAVTSSTLLGAGGSATSDVAGSVASPLSGAAIGAGGQGISGIASLGGAGTPVSAGLGRASMVGPVSVPPSWTAPAPLTSPLASTLGGTPMVAPPPAMATGAPGMPIGAVGGQPYGRAMPQYGFRPSFVARPPAAG
ncbi:PPE family protein [Mycobacterium saskatchewanense]|uniref:PPE family protein n=1 Tax=Mycobacterium saskatchewanense TaxID=220927 RepID=A0AAJ3NNL4_9MYCO|nr:PPE family protein [Mycobacterium saskatchewanense]ORW70039.1 hypothetical protein AWC23_17745 [Mycobacterium saskatchewanense]BBX61508.1 PPE family protein [Mycobacterium saskatchewanense]